MRCFVTLGVLLLANVQAVWATDPAADNFAKNSKSSSKPVSAKERALAQFDTNGDGKLSEAERRAARTSLQKQKRLAKSEDNSPANAGTPTMAGMPVPTMPPTALNPYAMTGGYPTGVGSYPVGSASYFFYAGAAVSGTGTMGAGGQCMGMAGGAGSPQAMLGGMAGGGRR